MKPSFNLNVAFTFLLVVLPCTQTVLSQSLNNFSKAVVVAPEGLSTVEETAVQVLLEEIQERTGLMLTRQQNWPPGGVPTIAVWPSRLSSRVPASQEFPGLSNNSSGAEGFRLLIETRRGDPAAWVIGNDGRGLLYGVGRLLREMRLDFQEIHLPESIDLSTAPEFPLRGHQLGFRPKTNSYDAFTAEMWEQYIRDLAVFGTNAIELIPPRSDDADDSPHFPLPQIEMMERMSAISDRYDMDVWIWYPALDADYSDPGMVDFALREWEEVYRRLPRIDAIFVPGGDPGHTRPIHLMNLLERQTQVLQKHHPRAEMWVSPQSFNREWMDEFYQILGQKPSWLTGVVFGPQIRVSLPELREAVPAEYPIRRYPDITHSLRSQYPVPDWDLAYALTEHREVINPRPRQEAVIFRVLDEFAPYGFLTYSEGVNDDVNKFVWSGLGWDSNTDVIEILREYSRYFIGPAFTDSFARGLLSLESNWEGPLLTNESVFQTLFQFQEMERNASPGVLLNWRFQQALYRAYYDAYQRARLLYETHLERLAMETLRKAPSVGSLQALEAAETILLKSEFEKIALDWRSRVFELAEALYQSIRMQLSVERYQAISVGRGANLDLIDFPLNNRLWLAEHFQRIRDLSQESQRISAIREILEWTNPGPGGFYDDLGNLMDQPHLVRGPGFYQDPAFLQSSLVGFACRPEWRRSWCHHAESLNNAPLQMRYEDLDPEAEYQIRVVYAGDRFQVKIKLLADELEVHPYIQKQNPPEPVEFDIPVEATRDGELILTWYREPGLGGAGRGSQVSEVWLIKKTSK